VLDAKGWFGFLCHLLFGFKEDRTILCPMVSISLMKHIIQRLFLISAPTSAPVGVATSVLLMILSCVIHSALGFLLWRSEVFLPVL
jgi:hypothetical protein